MQPSLAEQRDVAIQAAARVAQARKFYKEGVSLLEKNDYPRGGEFIVRAAQMGESAAEDHLGFLYEQGFFGAPDYANAVHWYRKSADQCCANGQFHLGACYQLGNGVEQSYEQAARWFAQAAKMGHPEASECLRMLSEMGVEEASAPAPAPPVVQKPAPVDARVVETPKIEEVAEAPEPAPAPKRVKAVQEIEPMPELPADLDDPSVTDAVCAYQTQAFANDSAAQLKLGLAYYKGRSAPADPKLACFWVMRSMLAGSPQGAQLLKYCTQLVPQGEHEKLQTTIFLWTPGKPVPEL
jgi:hypothetical protein